MRWNKVYLSVYFNKAQILFDERFSLYTGGGARLMFKSNKRSEDSYIGLG